MYYELRADWMIMRCPIWVNRMSDDVARDFHSQNQTGLGNFFVHSDSCHVRRITSQIVDRKFISESEMVPVLKVQFNCEWP